jgi:hypothetical protein
MRIVVKFEGGYRDGAMLDSANPSEAIEASGIYQLMTDKGTIGKGFRGISWEELKPISGNHCYLVSEKIEQDDVITLTMKYEVAK